MVKRKKKVSTKRKNNTEKDFFFYKKYIFETETFFIFQIEQSGFVGPFFMGTYFYFFGLSRY